MDLFFLSVARLSPLLLSLTSYVPIPSRFVRCVSVSSVACLSNARRDDYSKADVEERVLVGRPMRRYSKCDVEARVRHLMMRWLRGSAYCLDGKLLSDLVCN